MFYSDTLLSNEGPLAHVWLAANLERKLSKSQLLQADIQQSVSAIVNNTAINTQGSSNATTHSESEEVPIALRLSGQLLYGVVRIYSRKAKYLLDDCNDVLMKLKMVFRSAAAKTGPHSATSQLFAEVDIPVQSAIIANFANYTLPDTVTEIDLFELPDPFADMEISATSSTSATATATTNSATFTSTNPDNSATAAAAISLPNTEEDANTSLEFPRAALADDEDLARPDDDIDLNLGLSFAEEPQNTTAQDTEPTDVSMEMPRFLDSDAVAELDLPAGDSADPKADSLLDISMHVPEVDDLNLELDAETTAELRLSPQLPALLLPLSPGGEGGAELLSHNRDNTEPTALTPPPEDSERAKQPRQPPRKRLRMDPAIELQSSFIRAMQEDRSAILRTPRFSGVRSRAEEILLRPGAKVARAEFAVAFLVPQFLNPRVAQDISVEELAGVEQPYRSLLEPVAQRVEADEAQEAEEAEKAEKQPEEPETEAGMQAEPSMDFDFDLGIDEPTELRATPPAEPEIIAEEEAAEPEIIAEGEATEPTEAIESLGNSREGTEAEEQLETPGSISQSTMEVAASLRTEFGSKDETDYNSLVRAVAGPKVTRGEAVKTFFELLVLSTQDAVSLTQEPVFGAPIAVGPRERLFDRFL